MFSSIKKKPQLLCYIVLAIVFIKAFSFIFDAKIDLNGDNIDYYIYAKAILKGAYTNLVSPSNNYINSFPPGYPLILSMLMIFTKNIVALKIYNGIIFFGGVLLLFHTLDKTNEKKTWLFFGVAIACFINPAILDFATMMMSEMSYLLFIALTAFFLYKSKKDNPIKDIYFWLMLASAAYAYHIRTAGIAIMGGIMLFFLFNKKWKSLGLSVIGYIIFLLPWMIRNKIRGIGSSRYFSQMTLVNGFDPNAGTMDTKAMLHRFVENFSMLVNKAVPDALFSATVDYNSAATLGQWIIGLVLLAIIVFGLLKIKKLNYFFLGVLIATGATLLPWNGGVGTRYITAIIPILYLGLFSAIYFLAERFAKKTFIVKAIPIVLALIVFVTVKPDLINLNKQAKADFHPAYKNYFAIAKAVNKNTPKDAYICCRKAQLFYYFANRPCGGYAYSKNDKEVILKMYNAKFDYVVLEQLGYGSTFKYLYPAIQKNPQVFKMVMHLKKPDTYLFQFNKEEAEKLLGINSTTKIEK